MNPLFEKYAEKEKEDKEYAGLVSVRTTENRAGGRISWRYTFSSVLLPVFPSSDSLQTDLNNVDCSLLEQDRLVKLFTTPYSSGKVIVS